MGSDQVPRRTQNLLWNHWHLLERTEPVGTFTFEHDHMAELIGRQAEQVVATRKAEAA